MKQVNHGYAEYYYLLQDGSLYNAAADSTVKQSSKHTYMMKTEDNQRKKVSLKTLYRLVYGR